MTKPLPTGCIKDDKDISWQTFNFLLERVSFEDKIGHWYIVDTEFDVKKATKGQFAYNEIYPPTIEKQKTTGPCERSVFQLLEQFVMRHLGPKSYQSTAKANATLFKKKIIPLYLEDLVFCIKRTGWIATKIHSHLTFEQSQFKCQFVPIFDEHREITYINRYHNIFDKKISSFVTPDILKHKAEEEFNDKLMKLDKEDRFYEIKLKALEAERKSSL